MMHARHLSTAQALFRIFVQPSLSGTASRAQPLIRPRTHIKPASLYSAVQCRTAAQYRPPVQTERKVPYDEEIEPGLINFIDVNGAFHPAKDRDAILRRVNRITHHLVQVDLPNLDSEYPYPVCKILTKSFLREQERAQTRLKNRRTVEDLSKTIELNWGVSDHDLGHWMKRMVQFLEEGRRVDLVLGPKKRARKVTPEEAEVLLVKLRQVIASVPGAKERAEPEGQVGAVMTLFYEGKAKEKAKEVEEAKDEGDNKDKNGTPKLSRWKVKEEERRVAEEKRKKAEEERRHTETERRWAGLDGRRQAAQQMRAYERRPFYGGRGR